MKAWIAALAIVGTLAGMAAVDAAPVRRHVAAHDWSTVVSRRPDGAFVLGNPGAPVKLVEYLSFTCSHCAAFSMEAMPKLKSAYVRPGRVSVEFRNALRDPYDFVAAMLARCAGPAAYPGTAESIFAQQDTWLPRAAAAPPPPPMGSSPTVAQLRQTAQAAGLDAIVRARGVSDTRQTACLGNTAEQRVIAAMASEAWEQRHIGGTPSFMINGRMIADTSTWSTLEPHIQAALAR